jgi:hypothetical protein
MTNRQDIDEQVEATIRRLAAHPVAEDVATRHVALAAREAAGSARSVAAPVSTPLRPRRRTVLSTLLSSLAVKVLAGTVALASVGAGIAIAADGAAPGDALYGIDRAMERVGVLDGGPAERLAEAEGLVEADLPAAVETAGEAAAAAGAGDAAEALDQAAARVALGGEDEQVLETREYVAALLRLIASQLEGDGVDGEAVAEAARMIRPDVTLPEQVPQDEVPPVSVPPGELPPVTPVPTIPDSLPGDVTGAPPADVPADLP